MHDSSAFRTETVSAIHDPEIIRKCWEGYEEAHGGVADSCIQEQRCYSAETFAEALRDPEYIIHLLFHGDTVVGAIGGTNNLEKARIAYVNPDVLRQQHPEAVAEGRLWYMPILFVRNEYQGRGCSIMLFEEHARYFWERGWMIASDYASGKHAWFNLDYFTGVYRKALTNLGIEADPDARRLGEQVYFSISFGKKAP